MKTPTTLISELAKHLLSVYIIKDKCGDTEDDRGLEEELRGYFLNNQIGIIDHKG
jgi:hypothetical protein